jgi:cell division septum initiation protein DivIVA
MKGQVWPMAATMTDSRQSTAFPEATEPRRPQLRVTRHGYDPADVHALLASARGRLVALADRIRRAEAANVALVAETKAWKERARIAEADRRRLEDALAAAEATVATSIAEVQIRADHLVERARCEAEHLTLRAQETARRVREEIELERMAHEATSLVADDLGLDADPEEDRVFSRFMSDEIADEPSREWVIGSA